MLRPAEVIPGLESGQQRKWSSKRFSSKYFVRYWRLSGEMVVITTHVNGQGLSSQIGYQLALFAVAVATNMALEHQRVS
jgi:hypothetical protein